MIIFLFLPDKLFLAPFIVRKNNNQLRLSSPHTNLFRNVFKKLSELYSIILMVKGAFLTRISLPLVTDAILESKDTRWFFALPDTFKRITVSSEITKGRAFRLCGAI